MDGLDCCSGSCSCSSHLHSKSSSHLYFLFTIWLSFLIFASHSFLKYLIFHSSTLTRFFKSPQSFNTAKMVRISFAVVLACMFLTFHLQFLEILISFQSLPLFSLLPQTLLVLRTSVPPTVLSKFPPLNNHTDS